MRNHLLLADHVGDPTDAEALPAAVFESMLLDRRKFHRPSYRDKAGKLVFYTPRLRKLLREGASWKETTGVVVHQTACDMGTNPERYDTIGAHFSGMRDGRVNWHADLNRYVIHANGFNQRCVGYEVNGLYAGLEDDPRTAHDEALATTWDDPTTKHREKPMRVEPVQLYMLRATIRWCCYVTARNDGHMQFLLFHRQSSGTRQNDPGEAIARGVEPLYDELGLSDGGPGFKIDNGRPIPDAWRSGPARGVRY